MFSDTNGLGHFSSLPIAHSMDQLEHFFSGFHLVIINGINDDFLAENLISLAEICDLFGEDNGNDDDIEGTDKDVTF